MMFYTPNLDPFLFDDRVNISILKKFLLINFQFLSRLRHKRKLLILSSK